MKKYIPGVVMTSMFLCMVTAATAQQPRHRCATMEVQQRIIREDPSIVQQWKAEGELQQEAWRRRQQQQLKPDDLKGPQPTSVEPLIIPVVFHLVGDAGLLQSIPDRDVYEQVEILNRDFAGGKADLYNGLFAPELAARIGKVPIRFVLARRTPANNPTSGIERRISTKTFSGGLDGTAVTIYQLKSTSAGGLDPWDPSHYLNIWCASFTDGLLGIATFPFTNAAAVGPQGVAIDLYTIGGNACRIYYASYNEGTTLSHEIGHYFYCYHTFGDQTFCNNTDFNTQPGWPLTAGVTNDDTPAEKGHSNNIYGNISGIYSDGCSNTSYGMMYQNFMNYYDDRALYMFSAGQQERMMATIDMYRSSLLQSNGATPPSAVSDAWLVTLAPLGKCDTKIPIVNNTPLSITIRNSGTTTLTSVILQVQVDGGAPVSTPFALNLGPGKDTLLSAGLISGSMGDHTLTLFTASPNGNTDQYPQNDTLRSYINIRTNTITAPFTESFSSPVFPPQLAVANDHWLLNNPQRQTWEYSTTAGATVAGAVVARNFTYNEYGELDELITPPIDFGNNDSALLSFAIAHAQKSLNTQDWDGLEVYISGDGGQHYTMAYKKVSDKLRTVPNTSFSPFEPATDPLKWRTETINLTPYLRSGQPMIIKFRNLNAHGNNIFLDDIGVSAATLPPRDLTRVSLQGCPPYVCSTVPIIPSFTFGNAGTATITSFTIHYRLDNGTTTTIPWTGILQKGEQATQVLNALPSLSPGHHELTVYTTDPNGQPDQRTTNDTIRTGIHVLTTVNAPVNEGFEATGFPSASWGIIPSGSGYTWERTTRAATEKTAAVLIRNYRFSSPHQPDILYSSPISVTAIDSVYLDFAVAHATSLYPGETGQPTDTLEVLVSKDCGSHFISVYKKWGIALETTGRPEQPVYYNRATDPFGFVPSASQWRQERIDLTSFVPPNSSFQVLFRNTSNNDNNTYLDNIRLSTILLPEQLKTAGYLLAPNPARDWIAIMHLRAPADLQAIVLSNMAGQVLYQQRFKGDAGNYLRIDLKRFSSGVYVVKLVYDKKVIAQKIVKK